MLMILVHLLEKLSSIVRSVTASDQSTRSQQTPTPTAWDSQTVRPRSRESNPRSQPRENRDSSRDSRDSNHGGGGGSSRDSRDSRDRTGRFVVPPRTSHSRNDSEATGPGSSVGYPETAVSGPPRRHDYDVQAMESNLSPRTSVTRNPIPPPVVSVRSEFPTLNRSRQQQTLTCLVTIEVTDNKWRPDPDDLRSAPPMPPIRPEDTYARPPSPAQSAPRFYPYESPEVLEEITDTLRNRVENWHGLDFNRCVHTFRQDFTLTLTHGQVRQAEALRDHSCWQRQAILARAGMLPLRGNAHLREGEEELRAPSAMGRSKYPTPRHSVHPERIHPHQETLE